MPRKPAVFVSALALAALGLTACGDDSATTPEDVAPTATVEETAPEDTATDDSADAQDDDADAEDKEQTPESKPEADSPAGSSDPGPAPEGAVIPAEAVANPPESIGEFTLRDGSGPAYIYADDIASTLISVDSNVLTSSYEALVEYIETENTPAGTGSCGTNESGSSITCYQLVDGGVLTINAYPEEISLEKMVVFVNKFAEQAGAA